MPESQRTVFATLLASHRRRLGLTQASLAGRIDRLRREGAVPRTVTERTIVALERMTRDRPRVPHVATVRALATALELAPGTPDHDAFIAAALDPAAVPPPPASLVEPDAAFIAAGRESQLGRLEAAIDRAAGGLPSVALLTGEAGSGKTRLLEEACRRALSRHDRAVVLWGTCPRGFGAMADHEPWREMLGHLLGDPAADAGGRLPAVNARRLATRLPIVAEALAGGAAALVGTLAPVAAVRRPEVLDALATDLRHRLEGVLARSLPVTQGDLATALVQLLGLIAARGPVVLVVDDLHWADDATRISLRHLLREMATRGLPIAVLGSIRTGDTSDPPAARTAQDVLAVVTAMFPDAVVDLAPAIGGRAGRAFVDAAVAPLRLEPLADRLFERTSGQPLYVMGFLRLHAMNDTAIAGSDIPAEIAAVFARQHAHLDERARRLLAAASVQGDDFLAEPALAAAGIQPGDGSRLLDSDLAGQVRPAGVRDVIPGVTMRRYRFAHAVLRDHVLGTVSPLERSHLHLATADALAGALGPRGHDAVELIATQLEQGGDLRRAATAWIEAGDRAMLRSDHRHAQAIYRHIRTMGLEEVAPEAHVQAQVGIGNTHRALGHPAEARLELQRARRAAVRRNLRTIAANALLSLGVLDFDAGRMVGGAARFAQAIDAYTLAGDLEEASRAHANLGFVLHGAGRYDEAREHAEAAIALAQDSGSAAARASAEIALANTWLELGDYEHAIARYTAGLARNEANTLTHYGNLCLLNIALCRIELGQLDDAEATLDQLDDPDRRLIDRLRAALAFNRGLLADARGDVEAARRRYDASREIRERLGQAPLVIDSLAGLLRGAVATADAPAVERLLAEIDTRLARQGTIGVEHAGRLFLAMIDGYRLLDDEATATAWLADAMALLGERADRLADPGHRERYLTRPPAHRRLVDLARTFGVPAPGTRSPRG
jgi:predicted ATPase